MTEILKFLRRTNGQSSFPNFYSHFRFFCKELVRKIIFPTPILNASAKNFQKKNIFTTFKLNSNAFARNYHSK